MFHNKRKTKIVDLKTQSLIALEMMLHALILPLLMIIFLSVDPFSTFLSNQTAETHFTAARDFMLLNINKWPLLIIGLLFVGITSIIFSHHIAGPTFRFVKAFRSLMHGDFTERIRLRRWDYLKEAGLEFNTLLNNLNDEFKTITATSKEISESADNLAKSRPEIAQDLGKILTNAKKIKGITDKYKLA